MEKEGAMKGVDYMDMAGDVEQGGFLGEKNVEKESEEEGKGRYIGYWGL